MSSSFESLKNFLYNNSKVIALITLIIVVILITIMLSKKHESNIQENYYYNSLDKATLLKILSKDCILSLRDYSNILNSTENLRTLFLQQICNNYVCDNYQPQNEEQLFGLLKTIAGQCIIKCIKTNDIYRLALVNLKINDMITSIPHPFKFTNFPVFKRALTNGVYGVESINMYLAGQQQNVKDIIGLYNEKLPKLRITDKQMQDVINKQGLSGNDSSLYKDFVTNFINKVKLNDKYKNDDKEFSVNLFVILSTITLYDMMVISSITCP